MYCKKYYNLDYKIGHVVITGRGFLQLKLKLKRERERE